MSRNSSALLPSLGLNKVFGSESATIAIPMAVIIAVIIWVVLEKTKFGYEIKATGLNRNAAKYCGMREKRNIILTMLIAGALAGIAAAMMFLSGFMEWDINQSSVPAMGFNGIAAAFLGGLNPIGAIFSSYFIQHITDGGSSLDTRLYPTQISDLISSLIIYLCGFVLFFKLRMNARIDGKTKTNGRGRTGSVGNRNKGGTKLMMLLIQYTLVFSSVLLLVALGGCFSERSGIINIGLEGIMVIGALGGVMVLHNLSPQLPGIVILLLTVAASIAAGMIYSLLLAVASINFKADQTLVGTAMNMLGLALATVIAKAYNIATTSGADNSARIAFVENKKLLHLLKERNSTGL